MPCRTCSRNIYFDVYLTIRHGTILVLRNTDRRVAKELMSVPIIGRRVLEPLGYDYYKLLETLRDEYGDDINVPIRPVADGNEETRERDGNIIALSGESAFHNNVSIENDGLRTRRTCVDFEDDTRGEVEKT